MAKADDPKFRTSFFDDEYFFLWIKWWNSRSSRLKVLNQVILSVFIGLQFDQHHFFYTSFNEKIRQLTRSGIIEHWLSSQKKRMTNVINNVATIKPVVLIMEHLSIGFLIWTSMLSVAATIFFLQFMIYWIPKVLKLVIFKRVLGAFYDTLRYH